MGQLMDRQHGAAQRGRGGRRLEVGVFILFRQRGGKVSTLVAHLLFFSLFPLPPAPPPALSTTSPLPTSHLSKPDFLASLRVSHAVFSGRI